MSEALSIYSLEEVKAFFIFLDNHKGARVEESLLREFGLSKDKAAFVAEIWRKGDQKIPVEKRARVAYVAHGGVL